MVGTASADIDQSRSSAHRAANGSLRNNQPVAVRRANDSLCPRRPGVGKQDLPEIRLALKTSRLVGVPNEAIRYF
jgi:hypothetical protein